MTPKAAQLLLLLLLMLQPPPKGPDAQEAHLHPRRPQMTAEAEFFVFSQQNQTGLGMEGKC
jgi:hypothetical protein